MDKMVAVFFTISINKFYQDYMGDNQYENPTLDSYYC